MRVPSVILKQLQMKPLRKEELGQEVKGWDKQRGGGGVMLSLGLFHLGPQEFRIWLFATKGIP